MGNFNILDVINYHHIATVGENRNENEIKIQCPFCGDARGKATIKLMKDGKEANVFHCWACNKGNNMVTLHYDLNGGFKDYKEAYRDLQNCLGHSKMQNTNIEKQKNVKIQTAKRASDTELDKTYRIMLSFIRLREKEKNDLIKRSLTEEEIATGLFCSTPNDKYGICRKLLKAGCKLEGVPGFYKDTTGVWTLNVFKDEGYFCPVFQEDKIVGMQIRLNKQHSSCKYIWLSSAEKEMGTPAGTPASFYGNPNSPIVIITEGILKSYVIHCMWPEATIIGVPGVSAINGLRPLLNRHNHKIMIECYDMDKRERLECFKDYKETTCAECCQNKFCHYKNGICLKKIKKSEMLSSSIVNLKKIANEYHMSFKSYYWDMDYNTGKWLGYYKGMDDYLAEKRKGKITHGNN